MLRTLAILGVLSISTANAQPSPIETRGIRLDGQTVSVETHFGEGLGRVRRGRQSTELFRGQGIATIVQGHGVGLVAYVTDDEEPFRVRVVRRDEVGEEVTLARPSGQSHVPFSVVATPLPDGFAVFFQEVQTNDPSAAHTYLARFSAEGVLREPAREVAIPWGLADAIWNGEGYHLALIYPGNGRGMRLSMVSTTPAGRPQQHPDWASAAGAITNVHLARSGERILAFYANGNQIMERDVTQIGPWGREPSAGTRRGQLGEHQIIVLRSDGDRVRPTAVRAR
ncbi:MAG: hypothetical protein AAGE52_00620 [Myxococcota bacterium]